jgi:tripartite-type tricarboxylate transporter receptor subunit TctC
VAPGASFPDKARTLTHIVAYPPGGGTDVTARLLAPMLEKELGIQAQVLNKPGAGGQIGFTEIARSRPDGYTIGNLILPTVITTYLDPQRKAVFSRKSFELLALQDNDPGIIGQCRRPRQELRTTSSTPPHCRARSGPPPPAS